MISISFLMILKSVIASAVIGVISGVLYGLVRILAKMIRRMIFDKLKVKQASTGRTGLLANSFDFFYTVTIGCAFLLSLYVFLDGVFEIYSFIALILSFVYSTRLVQALTKLIKRHKMS